MDSSLKNSRKNHGGYSSELIEERELVHKFFYSWPLDFSIVFRNNNNL